MKKIFDKTIKIFLVAIMVVMQFIPSISVFADVLAEEVGLTVKVKEAAESQYQSVRDEYTFNYVGTAFNNYNFKVATSNYVLDNDYYLLVIKNEVFSNNDETSIDVNTNKVILTKDSNGIVSYDFNTLALKFNGKMNIKLSLFDITDIYTNELTADGVDLTSRDILLSKDVVINASGYSNEITLNSLKYDDGNDISYDIDNKYYTVDYALLTNKIDVSYTAYLGNTSLNDKYYAHYKLNGVYLNTMELNNFNVNNSEILAKKLINGQYNYVIEITNKEGEKVVEKEILLNVSNSLVTMDKATLTDNNFDLYETVNYMSLSEEEKTNLALSEQEIEILNNNLKKYETANLVDEFLNSVYQDINFNSYNEINGKDIATTSLYGTLKHINAYDYKVTIDDLYNLLSDVNKELVVINGYDQNGNKILDDKYLETNMTLDIIVRGVKNSYKLFLLGNVGSSDGYIAHDDIINIIDMAIGSSNLDDIYHLAGDINNDSNVDVLDVSGLMYHLKDGSNAFLPVGQPISSNIEFSLNPSETNIRVGDTFELTLLIKNINNNAISGLEGIINYDESKITCVSVLNLNDWYGNINVINNSKIGNFITSGYTEVSENQTVLTYTFKALKEGMVEVYVDSLVSSLNGVEVSLNKTKTNTVVVNVDRALSTNNNISDIKFNVGKLDKDFNKDILRYTLYVDYRTTSVSIDGLLEDVYALTNSFKEYQLTGYKTVIELPVTAEDGSIKTYVVEVIKVDNRSSNNYLNDLTIDGVKLNFDKDTLEYNVTVVNSVTELSIKAVTEDESADVTITGNKDLDVGENVIEVKVTAENGKVRVYKINVTREASEVVPTENDNNNTKLILIVLIIATILALLYLIFKDDKKEEIKEFRLNDKMKK